VTESLDITSLLRLSHKGDAQALEKVFQQLYATLRSLAQGQLRREHGPRTLTPTALVNEAFLQVYHDGTPPNWENRRHLMSVIVRAMRQVLIDSARRRNAQKRPQEHERVDISDITSALAGDVDIIKLDGVVERLAKVDARQADIVELRFFGGLSIDEIAEQLDISPRTVGREWRMARAWLRRALGVDEKTELTSDD